MTETLLDVKDMHCGACVRRIDAALTQVTGVRTVAVALAEGRVRVRHAAEVAPDALVEALAEAGYASAQVAR